MTLFLTSSPSGCPFEPGPAVPVLDRRNHFLENLRAVWPDHPVRGLAIAADPHAYAQNDEMCRVFLQSFADAHLPLTELVPCDARNQEEIGTLLPRSGFVMLCGGHVPTQNHFFAQLGLPGLFHNYHGIVLGVSAGSMNAARLVYAAPEEPGEAADPGYCRWLNGLGLTETRILPHYQFIREHVLDGQKMEDIALADSILPGPRHALFRSSLYAYYIWKLMNDNNAVETVKHELDRLKTKIHNELSPEERIEWEFLTGLSLDFSSLATEAYDNIGKAIPYVCLLYTSPSPRDA